MSDYEPDVYEHPDHRNARMLAEVQAHPSYEAVKAAKGGVEPSLIELDEYTEAQAFAKLPKAQKIAGMLDAVLATAANQIKHNAPVSPDMIRQLEAIRSLLV